jgi:hypothetical protein
MKITFLTEMGFEGKIPADHYNMRTEFSWINTLDADHKHIHNFQEVKDYDHVFIIFPKGMTYLNSFAVKLSTEENPVSKILRSQFVDVLKKSNKKIHFVQEGPHWLWNDYSIYDQIYYYNMIASCDSIFCHNEHDSVYYKGMFKEKPVNVIPTLLIHELIKDINQTKENKAIIGGNMSRWYGGFESYIVANEFATDIFVQDSHSKRDSEHMMDKLNHLPRMIWIEWMKKLSTFKYAVHMMPTIAAGTFSLNCAYFGIPCIGNRDVDTQKLCHPNLAVDVQDVQYAVELARKLKEDKDFYEECSYQAKNNYKLYYSIDNWKEQINNILNETK